MGLSEDTTGSRGISRDIISQGHSSRIIIQSGVLERANLSRRVVTP